METDLPSSTFSDGTLLNRILNSTNFAVPFSMFESVYFKRNNYADKYDADVNPDHISQGTEIECRYFNFHEELLNLTGNKECLSLVSLNIRSSLRHQNAFFTDLVHQGLDVIGFLKLNLLLISKLCTVRQTSLCSVTIETEKLLTWFYILNMFLVQQ